VNVAETFFARSRKAARLVGALAYIRAARLAGDQPPIYLDVGARGGLPPAWWLARKFGLIKPAYCEPDAAEAERLTKADPGAIIIPYAFGQIAESRTLYITREPGRSSLLFPECPSVVENGREDSAHATSGPRKRGPCGQAGGNAMRLPTLPTGRRLPTSFTALRYKTGSIYFGE
jgi:hypothetical protein